MKSSHTGFTLIELLVAVAVVAILSGVIMAALGSSRNSGSDGGVKSDLIEMHAQAELFYYANNNSYVGVCNAAAAPNGTRSINPQAVHAAQLSGVAFQRNAVGSASFVTCNDSATNWAAEAPLRGGGFFCADRSGASVSTGASTLTAAGDVSCN